MSTFISIILTNDAHVDPGARVVVVRRLLHRHRHLRGPLTHFAFSEALSVFLMGVGGSTAAFCVNTKKAPPFLTGLSERLLLRQQRIGRVRGEIVYAPHSTSGQTLLFAF